MKWLMYVSWVLGPVLQITLLVFMVQRKLHATFPRFFSYVLFQVIKSGCLFAVYHYACANYFYAYWTGNALSVLLAVTVMDEVWCNLFRPYEGIQNLGSLLFRWACVVLLLIASAMAISGQGTPAERVVATVLSFDRSLRIMQCGLFFLLVLFSRFLKFFWRQHVFGIALGFGIFASVELILVSILLRYGDGQIAIISLVKSTAYNAVTLLWIAYIRQRSPVILAARELGGWNVSLTKPPEAIHADSLIAMVEQAAERVLARSSWPRAPVRGGQVISRKPGPEERN
jgi:hypothetical protein